MPAAIFLETSHLEVDPGRDVFATVTVRNTGQIVDEFRFDLVGVPAVWATVTPPSISLFPGTGGAVQVRFAPPRDPSVPPTTETFGVRVRSSADPTFSYVEEGDLTVRPFAELAARIVPRSSRASLLRRRARHRLVVENTGNAALVVEAAAADPDERLDLSVVPPAVTVNPGSTATLLVAARARERVISGQPRTLQFVVAAAPAAGSPPTTLLTPGGPVSAPLRPPGRLNPLIPGTGSLLRLDGSVVVRPLLAFGLPQLAAVAVPLALVAIVVGGALGRGGASPTLPAYGAGTGPVGRRTRRRRLAHPGDGGHGLADAAPDTRGGDRVAQPGPSLGHRVRDRARRQPRCAGRLARRRDSNAHRSVAQQRDVPGGLARRHGSRPTWSRARTRPTSTSRRSPRTRPGS